MTESTGGSAEAISRLLAERDADPAYSRAVAHQVASALAAVHPQAEVSSDARALASRLQERLDSLKRVPDPSTPPVMARP